MYLLLQITAFLVQISTPFPQANGYAAESSGRRGPSGQALCNGLLWVCLRLQVPIYCNLKGSIMVNQQIWAVATFRQTKNIGVEFGK